MTDNSITIINNQRIPFKWHKNKFHSLHQTHQGYYCYFYNYYAYL